jgi:hypothetical protein
VQPSRSHQSAKDGKLVHSDIILIAQVNEAGEVLAVATIERETGLEKGLRGSGPRQEHDHDRKAV